MDNAVVIALRKRTTDFTPLSNQHKNPTGQTWTMAFGYEDFCENFVDSDPPTAAELSAGLSVVELHIDDYVRAKSPQSCRYLIDGAAVEALCRVEVGKPAIPTRYVLERQNLEEVFRVVVTEPSSERVSNPGFGVEWVESLVGVSSILVEIFRQLDIESASLLGSLN